MRTKRYKRNVESTSYDLSISDMMAALCCVFVLVCITLSVQLKNHINEARIEKEELIKKNKKATSYFDMRNQIYQELEKTFRDDIENEILTIDKDTLSISFKNPDVLFEMNSPELREYYKGILNDFFPKLTNLLYTTTFSYDGEKKLIRNEIDELRIEGHTASSVTLSDEKNYQYGMQTSQERTRNTLEYCLKIESLPEDQLKWVKKKTAAIGYSNSRHIVDEGSGIENQEASRRVEFRILTNATNVLSEIEKYK